MNFSGISRTGKNRLAGSVFILVFLGLCWAYDYPHTFFQSPQSVHVWRQTNSLSVAWMYYKYDVPFLQPEIQGQIADGGLSGKTAGEFPLLYYLVSRIWKVTGKSEFVFRIFQLSILFAGLFALYKMLISLLGNGYKAGFLAFLVFTSPMMVFYGPNFLPDAPALAFTFMAWVALFRFVRNRHTYSLWFSAMFFFLAISMKPTVATSFIAIGLWVLAEPILIKPGDRIFHFRAVHCLPFILSLLGVFSWFLYAGGYNRIHAAEFSTLSILPFWKVTPERMAAINYNVRHIYLREFFSPQLQFITVLVWLYLLLRIRKLPLFLGYLLIVMPLGFLCILALWFRVLDGHDYYLISQMPVLLLVWTAFFIHMKDKKYWNHPLVYILILGVFILLANDGSMRHRARYESWMNEGYKRQYAALPEMEPLLKQWNVGPEDKIICTPDPSINASLYYLNRKGYTDFKCDFSREETFRKCISQGAKFLFVLDTNDLQKPALKPFTTDPAGVYKNVRVYRLRQ